MRLSYRETELIILFRLNKNLTQACKKGVSTATTFWNNIVYAKNILKYGRDKAAVLHEMRGARQASSSLCSAVPSVTKILDLLEKQMRTLAPDSPTRCTSMSKTFMGCQLNAYLFRPKF